MPGPTQIPVITKAQYDAAVAATAALQTILDTYGESTGWVNISLAFAAKVAADYAGSSAPTSATISSDATGTTTGVQNNVSVDGFREGPSVAINVTDIFPTFVNDGTWSLTVLGVKVSGFTTASLWQTIGVTDAPGAAMVGRTFGIRDNGGSSIGVVCSETAGTIVAGAIDAVRGEVGRAEDTSVWNVIDYAGTAITTPSTSGVVPNPLKITIAWGCASATSSGPHSGKVLWFAKAEKRPASDPRL